VFGKPAVLDPDNIRSDPCDRAAVSREASVDDNVIALRDDELMFVTPIKSALVIQFAAPSSQPQIIPPS
jgi:hypothetical protein